jgi:hypothetical protein
MTDSQGSTTAPAVLDCMIASNRYGEYCIPANSARRPAAQRVASGEVYEPQTIAYLTERCGRKDIVHAGSYFGDFLPALSAAIDEQALIWAFEPNLENHRCAQITMKLNIITNVRLHHAGLGRPGPGHWCRPGPPRAALGGGSHMFRKAPAR